MSRKGAKNAKKVFNRCDLCSLARKKDCLTKAPRTQRKFLIVATFAAEREKKSSRKDAKDTKMNLIKRIIKQTHIQFIKDLSIIEENILPAELIS